MSPRELASLVLSFGVAAVASALLAWQRSDRRRRGPDLSDEDALHFYHQEVRRWWVAVVMFLLAAGVYVGSRIDPRVNGKPNVWFFQIWLGAFLLVFVLVSLAWVDWFATRRYASRHRKQIVREGLEILRDEMRSRAGRPANDRAGLEDDGASHP